ncbi:hypothetical protein [Methylopila turkensis]|uniref:Oxygen tolerance n=1 Tax=Methylopila turkensis TaxID=1437816 RepID=A0A9W6N760_9HYPH|nr:hypothetical protein [Methylopila turkensis]GLK80934.1 hypothetical protein GCM10008174_26750 [Methylopila turkensis]
MVTRLLRALTLAFAVLAASGAIAQPSEMEDVRLTVTPLVKEPPYPHELVLLQIEGVYRPLINREKLVQPELVDFAWAELGKDTLETVEDDGFAKRRFVRIIAVYPNRSGKLRIAPFIHRLSVVDGARSREIEVRSAPVTLDVAEWKGPGGPNDASAWWLPARSVEVTDEWSGDPDHVPRGETLRRTVTILADGVPADMLPATPVLRSPGVISFKGPSDRETKIAARGPISRATYSWEIRPTTAFPATVQEIRIPWFDTGARKMREAVIPARRMAWAAAADETGEPPPPKSERPPLLAALGAGVVALLAGFGVLLAGGGAEGLRLPKRAPAELRAMRRAARRGDASAFRAALTDLARAEPETAARLRADPAAQAGVAALDRRLFADAAPEETPDLRKLAAAVAKARRAASGLRVAPRSALAPLDGARPTS